mgnify:FL=1
MVTIGHCTMSWLAIDSIPGQDRIRLIPGIW